MRAQILTSIKLKDYSCNRQILGKIAYVNSIEDGFKKKLMKYIESIIKKSYFTNDESIVVAFNGNKLFSELPDMEYVEEGDFPF